MLWKTGLILIFVLALLPQLSAREKDGVQYGAGLIINVPFPEDEVSKVVQEVVQNGLIRGTKEYNKDEYIAGATAEASVRVFPAWSEGGQVFYKVRLHALDPRNFKDSGDVGTLAVRYVVQPQGEKNTVLQINAVFVEEFRHTVHQSNGSVEAAEYKDIHDRLEAIASMQAQTAEAEHERERQLSQHFDNTQLAPPTQPGIAGGRVDPPGPPTEPIQAAQTIEQHLRDLRSRVERLVKSPGAALKSAPFHTASTLRSLPSGSEVLIVISTPYWFGVETHEGQHGWILRDELEELP
ncbi:MAG TPA: hypothetical protein VLZ30_01735 [Verrucomicrobiae bacterium]|nr:hypothetical protein [Verrucomicrobiae bacterium]